MVQFLCHIDAQDLKANLPDINFLHNELMHWDKGLQNRQKLYKENSQQNGNELVGSCDAFVDLFAKIVNPGMEMLQEVAHLIGGIPDLSIATDGHEGTPHRFAPVQGLQVRDLQRNTRTCSYFSICQLSTAVTTLAPKKNNICTGHCVVILERVSSRPIGHIDHLVINIIQWEQIDVCPVFHLDEVQNHLDARNWHSPDPPQALYHLNKVLVSVKNAGPVFSPQSALPRTPGDYTDGQSSIALTPISSLHSAHAGLSVQDVCSLLDKVSKALAFLMGSTNKFVQASEGIAEKKMSMAKEVGKLYALIFGERDSREPSLSTNTILDNLAGAESLTTMIEADRVALSEEFNRIKTGIRKDVSKSEHRLMMCTFFTDPDAFFTKYMKKAREAERHQRTRGT